MQRTTITLDDDLMTRLDEFMADRRYANRSEAIRDLVRAGLERTAVAADPKAQCLAAAIYVYDHESRELASRLTHAAHDHHDLAISTLHVHLDHDHCLEVLILKGKSAAVRKLAEVLISTKGVKHGRLTITTSGAGL